MKVFPWFIGTIGLVILCVGIVLILEALWVDWFKYLECRAHNGARWDCMDLNRNLSGDYYYSGALGWDITNQIVTMRKSEPQKWTVYHSRAGENSK